MKIETSPRPTHDDLVATISQAINVAQHNGKRRGEAAMTALLHAYPEGHNAILNLDPDVMDANVFHVQDRHPGDPRWQNFWYVIGRLYGVER